MEHGLGPLPDRGDRLLFENWKNDAQKLIGYLLCLQAIGAVAMGVALLLGNFTPIQ
jgi:hypothetical protein